MSPFNQKLQPQAPVRVAIDRVDGNVTTFLADSTTPTQKAAVSAAGAVKVDGSGVTQPVSGTVTANAGTNLNTSALALEATLTAIKDTAGVKKITDALPAGTNTVGNVKVTDGTNFLPTGDVAARRIFTTHTDGTNSQPTMDVAARAGFQKLTDGTNTIVQLAANDASLDGAWSLPIAGRNSQSGFMYPIPLISTSVDGVSISGSGNQAVNVAARLIKYNGTTMDRVRVPNIQNGGTALTTVTLSAGGAGKKHRLHQILVSASAVGNITVSDFSTFVLQLDVANKTYQFGFPDGIVQSTANTAINFTHSVAGTTLYVFLHYNTE